MVKVAVAGAAGRMGRRILALSAAHEEAVPVSGFEAPNSEYVGRPLSELAGVASLEGVVADSAEKALEIADVLVDFTVPEATMQNLAVAARLGKACVIGTTGLSVEEREKIASYAKEIPVVFAPNMSVGMNLMFKLAGMITKVLGPDYALEVLEAHHDQKKDAPSGTAVKIIDELAKQRGWDVDEVCAHGRKGLVGARPKEEIGVSVIRGGDIVGEHTVYYIGQGERLELTHKAQSRDTFVQGAIRAAVWISQKEPGLYDMPDVLGLTD
ncbi:4-hydroxy-tetrahydrodipicolinate reductase [Dethiosulfatarculus sandiegensis]|uniref:4-hydroxy-tetrahydrodipicolinate reductase n=1 Tax=Dethiosulfatarculus sandiegensis TaxID=1429043 RepID=A0A0D2J7J1_9BACT|nr:4-hydroxy-tetrahydrodipicolinate reductase [Dethiosulfatarculus sandiegensis]KIX11696.1 dihydrodipicolinate reductase [Dethiosulfatarculus sandiegensis]